MNYIVFNNSASANALNDRITFDLQNVWSDGITNNYCEVKKHPTQELWAVIIEPNYEQYFTQQELNSSVQLTSDWNTTPIIE